MQDISSALPTLLNQHSDNEDVRRSVVFAVWRRIAGVSLVSHAIPIGLNETTLTVAGAERMWQRNLQQLAKEMIFKMNFVFGTPQVKFIEFVIDKGSLMGTSADLPDRARLEAEALDQITEPLRKAADAIADDDLRRKFLLAAGSCLARAERLSAK